MEYVTLHKYEKFGGHVGGFGIEIKIAATTLPDLKTYNIWEAANQAAESIEAAVCSVIMKEDPKAIEARARNRELLSLFPEPIFAEEIPNRYCKDWCCVHLPWFVVTTKIGRFTIGWRKRVISIDWSETVGTSEAAKLFLSEDVTKMGKSIHAWNLEDAKRYIDMILADACN